MGVTVREKKKGSGEWWIFITHQGKRASKMVDETEIWGWHRQFIVCVAKRQEAIPPGTKF